MTFANQTELRLEQSYVAMLYRHLDARRTSAREAIRAARVGPTSGTKQGMTERDATEQQYAEELSQLNTVERGLCFGRLDLADGDRLYIGRIGLLDEDRDVLLVDWRARAATPFYRATAADPGGVHRRRHLRIRGREVIGLDDDVFDLTDVSSAERSTLTGEAALLATLTAPRTGRLSDIVATIQAEQDSAIRADLNGILVVQGGPGTGKTVVALHRVAYLLYTHREKLSHRGVLLIGPNPTFLRYIDQVLPALGETDVVLASIGDLYPGIRATGTEPRDIAAAKGDRSMVDVLARAVRDRQRVPEHDLAVGFDKHVIPLRRKACADAIGRAQRTRLPHNAARLVCHHHLLTALVDELLVQLHYENAADDDRAWLRRELRTDSGVQAALDTIWPRLSPEQLLTELYADDPFLQRDPAAPWTPADVPLLDEAAELLGDDGIEAQQEQQRTAADEQAEIDYAKEVMAIFGLWDGTVSDELNEERAALFARRYNHVHDARSTAERAANDREWAFGHVVVDEAQEISAMAWRMLLRRCPSRSMTVVGDLAQAGAVNAPTDWADVFDTSWQLRELTINYRTPEPIMGPAAAVLARTNPSTTLPTSVRTDGDGPWLLRTTAQALTDRLRTGIRAEQEHGAVAVICAATQATRLRRELLGTELHTTESLDEPVVVLSVAQSKGLEFDSVIVVEPADIARESDNDLYVALTRATQRLGILHTKSLPTALRCATEPSTA